MLQHLVHPFLQGNKKDLVELVCIRTCSVSKIAANLMMICHVRFDRSIPQRKRFIMIAHMAKHKVISPVGVSWLVPFLGNSCRTQVNFKTSVHPPLMLLGPQIRSLRTDFGPHALKSAFQTSNQLSITQICPLGLKPDA